MKKHILLLLCMLIILSNMMPISANAASPPNVAAPTAILIDAKTGRVLYEKNCDEKRYPASTTKIMTCILALELGKLDDIVTIGTNPQKIERGSSQVYLIPEEQVKFEDLVYALMLSSANDAAIAIAEHIAGSVEEFAVLMNNKAKELGANNTNFVNPSGLHHNDHYSTARDLSTIAKYAMNNSMFREFVSTVRHTIPATNKQPERDYIVTSNKLIWKTSKYRYENATGIKTGYTSKAQSCLVSGAKKDNTELIAVFLGSQAKACYTDSVALFEFGFSTYKSVDLLRRDQIVDTLTLNSPQKKVNLLASSDLSCSLTEEEAASIKAEVTIKENLGLPIAQGDVLGSVAYSIADYEIGKVDLVAAEDVEKPQLIKIKKGSWGKYVLWAILLFLFYRALVTYNKIKRRRNMSRFIYTKR